MLTKLDGKNPQGFRVLAETKVIKPGDTLRVPLEEAQNKDGSIKARKGTGLMAFVKSTPGKSPYTEWTMTVPNLLEGESFEIKAKGPKDVNIACEAYGLIGPNVPAWTSIVHVYRDGMDIGTVKKIKAKARRILDAYRNIHEAFRHFEATEESIRKFAEIVRIQVETIDQEPESAESESEDSEDEN